MTTLDIVLLVLLVLSIIGYRMTTLGIVLLIWLVLSIIVAPLAVALIRRAR